MRRPVALSALLGTITALSWIVATPAADAALTDAAVEPSLGEVGTAVTVSGSACPPGLLVNPSHAAVLVVTLGVTIDVAVPADGAWSVEFIVPAGALVGPHAIVATCTRDLLPLPYLPLTFTVTAAETPAPTTTINLSAAATTTAAPTTAPTTTLAAAVGTSTTLDPAIAIPPGEAPPQTDQRPSDSASVETTLLVVPPTVAPAGDPAPSTSTVTSVVTGETVVSADRIERDDRRRPLVFGALSPIGRGWIGALLSGLLAFAFASGVVAVLWFRWLRHSRAREWWLRWFNQILRIRTHARPPT